MEQRATSEPNGTVGIDGWCPNGSGEAKTEFHFELDFGKGKVSSKFMMGLMDLNLENNALDKKGIGDQETGLVMGQDNRVSSDEGCENANNKFMDDTIAYNRDIKYLESPERDIPDSPALEENINYFGDLAIQVVIGTLETRGLLAPDKRRLVKRSLIKLGSNMVLLQETKPCGDKVLEFIKYCYKWEGWFQDARGTSGGLRILWNLEVFEVVPIASNEFWMACNITCKVGGIGFPLVNIYGPIKTNEKLRVWAEIYEQLQFLEKHKVILAGDFSAILDIDDKVGGLKKSTKVMGDFRKFISKCQSMRWRDPSFTELLKNWWFVKRIQYIKNKIKHWNKISFKKIFTEKLRIEEELEDINNRVMVVGMDCEDYLKEKLLKEQYAELLNREEVYWRDKSRALWIAEGVRNTKFFHASSKGRRNKNKITLVLDDNGALKDIEAEIEQVALEHFERILGSNNQSWSASDGRLSEILHKLVSEDEALMLCEPYTLEEIKSATFELHPHKAPGPDGMTTEFYQRCWDFLGHDI
ncbi:uncharacterized protein LOC131856423 [Cryptomeria japonica]|uniref:uncharacterized protein LOC131856423 n=1 Tax=Cryptomeria japonica TaxID=3369 RepID=UPI0027DA389E|nr:uncharacterized protein LOC131856423 [Cryptomeria japonica]